MTSCIQVGCSHHQTLDEILRTVIVHCRSDVPCKCRIAEEEFGVLVVDKGLAQTVPEFGRVQTSLLATLRIAWVISGIQVATSRGRRILEVTEQIAIVETTAFGSEVHEPEISTIGVVGDVGLQRLLVKDLLEAIVPSLGEHHGIVQIVGDFTLEIHIELRTDNEDGRHTIHASHVAGTFVGSFAYKLLNPIGNQLIHVGTLHICLIMAEEQHVDDVIVGVFMEQISHFATLHHDVNHQCIHREILAGTSAWEVEQVVAVENVLREGLTGNGFARLYRDCLPVVLDGTFERRSINLQDYLSSNGSQFALREALDDMLGLVFVDHKDGGIALLVGLQLEPILVVKTLQTNHCHNGVLTVEHRIDVGIYFRCKTETLVCLQQTVIEVGKLGRRMPQYLEGIRQLLNRNLAYNAGQNVEIVAGIETIGQGSDVVLGIFSNFIDVILDDRSNRLHGIAFILFFQCQGERIDFIDRVERSLIVGVKKV